MNTLRAKFTQARNEKSARRAGDDFSTQNKSLIKEFAFHLDKNLALKEKDTKRG